MIEVEKMTPNENRVLVEVLKPEKMVGLLHIPETAQGKETLIRARVLKVGLRRSEKTGVLLPSDISPGDEVLIDELHGKYDSKFEVDGTEYRSMNYLAIAAVC